MNDSENRILITHNPEKIESPVYKRQRDKASCEIWEGSWNEAPSAISFYYLPGWSKPINKLTTVVKSSVANHSIYKFYERAYKQRERFTR